MASHLLTCPHRNCLLLLLLPFLLLCTALIVYTVISIPFRVGFSVEDTPLLFWSDVVIDSFFGVDIILTLRTAYDHDEVNTRRDCLRIFLVSRLSDPSPYNLWRPGRF